MFRVPFLYSLLQQGAEKSDMEIRDVKTTCVKRDLCAALGNQQFYACKIYVRATRQAISDCFIHFGTYKLISSPPDHLRFCNSDSEVIIGPRESFPVAYTENKFRIPLPEIMSNPQNC